MRVVISYDISDTKRRTKMAKLMEGHGYRVQYSVFECELDEKKLKELMRRLRPLVKVEEWESVRIYPLNADAEKRVKVLGKDLARIIEPVTII